MREREPCVYILASGRHGTIYIGVTSDLMARLHQHRTGSVPGFTRRYDVKRLVHFEMADTMDAAIAREKQLKAWRRDWKVALIERDNPFWEDRAIDLGFAPLSIRKRPSSRRKSAPIRATPDIVPSDNGC
jgi:putative endonuclease